MMKGEGDSRPRHAEFAHLSRATASLTPHRLSYCEAQTHRPGPAATPPSPSAHRVRFPNGVNPRQNLKNAKNFCNALPVVRREPAAKLFGILQILSRTRVDPIRKSEELRRWRRRGDFEHRNRNVATAAIEFAPDAG